MLGELTIEAIHLIRRHTELYKDRKKVLHMFVDLEKVYDRASHEVLWRCFERKEVSFMYVRLMKETVKIFRWPHKLQLLTLATIKS